MQMRNGLAHAIIDGKKSALRLERRFHCLGKQLTFEKERTDEMARYVRKRAVMRARAQKNVAWKQGTRIKERDYFVIFIDDGGSYSFGGDFAERAVCRKWLFARGHKEVTISAAHFA